MPQTSSTEFYSLSLNALAPPPYSPAPPGTTAPFDFENDHGKQHDVHSKTLVRRLTPPLLRVSSSASVQKSRLSKLWYDRWLNEIFHLLLGSVCLAAIAALLGSYSGKVLPLDLPLHFTLSGLIATLAAVAKYALAVPLNNCLGTQKWLWYSGTARPLLDFEKFDEASRDPVSALGLLRRVHTRSIGSVGAIIVLLSLAIDPFLQQVVDFSQRSSQQNRGTTPRVVNMTQHTALVQNGAEVVGNQGRMLDAIAKFYLTNNTAANFTAFCPNTECSYPVFDTLSLCSSCQDISTELLFGCHEERGEWKMNLTTSDGVIEQRPGMSCGWFFNSSGAQPMLMSGYSISTNENSTAQVLLMRQLNMRDPWTDETYWNGSIRFKATPNPLANFAVVAASSSQSVYANNTPAAFECVMQWCTQTIDAKFSQGTYHERVLAEFRNTARTVEPLTVSEAPTGLDYVYGQNVTLTPPGRDETFFVHNTSTLKTRFTFDRLIPNYLTWNAKSSTTHLRYNLDAPEGEGHLYAQVDGTRWLIPGGVGDSVREMATAMSAALRTTQHSVPVFGTGVLETYVDIRWEFFSLPLVVLGFTFILLGVTIMQTNFADSGKRSALFTLIHGLNSEARSVFGASSSMHAIREKAKDVCLVVDLGAENQGLGLSSQNHGPRGLDR